MKGKRARTSALKYSLARLLSTLLSRTPLRMTACHTAKSTASRIPHSLASLLSIQALRSILLEFLASPNMLVSPSTPFGRGRTQIVASKIYTFPFRTAMSLVP